MQLESSHRLTPMVNLYQQLWDGEVIHIWNPVSKRTWLLPGVDVGLPTAVGPSWKGWKLRPVPVELCTGGVVDAPVFNTLEKLVPVVRSRNKWEYRNKVFVSCSTSVIHFTYVRYILKENRSFAVTVLQVTAEKRGSDASWPFTRAWCNFQVCTASHTTSTTLKDDDEWLVKKDQTCRRLLLEGKHIDGTLQVQHFRTNQPTHICQTTANCLADWKNKIA